MFTVAAVIMPGCAGSDLLRGAGGAWIGLVVVGALLFQLWLTCRVRPLPASPEPREPQRCTACGQPLTEDSACAVVNRVVYCIPCYRIRRDADREAVRP